MHSSFVTVNCLPQGPSTTLSVLRGPLPVLQKVFLPMAYSAIPWYLLDCLTYQVLSQTLPRALAAWQERFLLQVPKFLITCLTIFDLLLICNLRVLPSHFLAHCLGHWQICFVFKLCTIRYIKIPNHYLKAQSCSKAWQVLRNNWMLAIGC